MSITVVKDLRALFGPVRDQDPRPTCMAFAGSDAHAGARPGWEPLSVEWAYYHALRHDGGQPHEGVTLSSMLATLRSDGQPVETAWPYLPTLFTNLSTYRPPVCSDPIYRRDSAPMRANLSGMVTELDQDHPVLFTMSLSRSFFMAGPDGIVSAAEPLEPARVHALVAVGHGTQGADRLILVRNSWGEGWALAGHAWLDEAYLSPRLLVAATLTGDL
jgi:hypothetical protein